MPLLVVHFCAESRMRFAWALGPCVAMGCGHMSSNDYAVAGGFAAAAGALQVAEMANKGPTLRACGPKTCQGCCDLADQCVDGAADDACGTGGTVCSDCAVNGQQACSEGSCSPTSTSGSSRFVSRSAMKGGGTSATQLSSPPCGRRAPFCFLGTQPVCITDDHGCQLCSCIPESRFDWATGP